MNENSQLINATNYLANQTASLEATISKLNLNTVELTDAICALRTQMEILTVRMGSGGMQYETKCHLSLSGADIEKARKLAGEYETKDRKDGGPILVPPDASADELRSALSHNIYLLTKDIVESAKGSNGVSDGDER